VQPDNAWLATQPGWDLAVWGEGEAAIVDLLLAARAGQPLSFVAGTLTRSASSGAAGPSLVGTRRAALPALGPVPSPYAAGILDPRDEDLLLVETTRGCVHGCAFCAYPAGRRALAALPDEPLLRDLALARERGVREVYLLDPSLGQRRDLGRLVALLDAHNPPPRLGFFAELRAEDVTPPLAAALARAGFREVELGLQTVSPAAQRTMRRRNRLDRFVSGAQALRDAGVRVKVDAIVGLPDDTPAGVRATLDFVQAHGLAADVLVFPLAVLPGTAFRADAARLGLAYQPHPPYQVRATPGFRADEIAALFAEAAERLDVDFGPNPEPLLADPAVDPSPARYRIDLDTMPAALLPRSPDHAFTLWLRAEDPYAALAAAAARAREAAAANPDGVLHLVLEAPGEPPFDVFDALLQAIAPAPDTYLEAFHEALAPPAPASRHLFVLLPAAAARQVDPAWRADLPPWVTLVWRLASDPATSAPAAVRRLRVAPSERVLLSLPSATGSAALRRLRGELLRVGLDPEQALFDRERHDRAWRALDADGS
jgi:hypothetical protein